MDTAPTCPPASASRGERAPQPRASLAPAAAHRLPRLVSPLPQPLHPLQRDRQHLEPPARLPALLHAGHLRPDGRAAGGRRLPRGLRHLLRLPLLLPGGRRLQRGVEPLPPCGLGSLRGQRGLSGIALGGKSRCGWVGFDLE